MASTWNNTVPLGRAGTGNAVIYGDNPVASQYANQLAALRQRQYQDYQLQQKAAEDQAKEWKDNQLAASEGRLWASDIGKLEQDHIQKGIELQQKGINPYGVDDAALEYQKERRRVQAQQGFRKTTEARLNDLTKLISANPDKYEPGDIKAVNDFFSNVKLNDAYSKNLTLPELRERFNVNDHLKGIQAVTKETKDLNGKVISEVKSLDKDATEGAILGTLSSDPRGVEYIKQMTSGVPLEDLKSYSTNPVENRKRITQEIMGNPNAKIEMANKYGIVPNTPEFNHFVDQQAMQEAQAKKKYDDTMEPFIARSANGVNFFNKNTPYTNQEDLARLRASLRPAPTAKASSVVAGVPTDTIIPYDQGKAAVEVKGFIPLSSANQNFGGAPAYTLSTIMGPDGKTVVKEAGKKALPLTSSNDYQVVGVGNFPLIKNNDQVKSIVRNTISQPDYAKRHPDHIEYFQGIQVQDKAGNDLVIPFDRAPTNWKNSKAVREALANFKPMSSPQAVSPSTKYKANGKSYTHADLLKMGYTEDKIQQAIQRGTLKK